MVPYLENVDSSLLTNKKNWMVIWCTLLDIFLERQLLTNMYAFDKKSVKKDYENESFLQSGTSQVYSFLLKVILDKFLQRCQNKKQLPLYI